MALWYRCGGSWGLGGGASAAGGGGGNSTGTCLAYSADGGRSFTKPALDAEGTNFVHRRAFDGDTVHPHILICPRKAM